MLKTVPVLALSLILATLSTASGQDYSVEVIDAAPDADEVPSDLMEVFAAKGLRIQRDSDRTACEVWLCKQWATEADFEVTQQRLYPFTPGQLIGLVHFPRRGKDFRDQSVSSGWYTMRFALQPVDGNHVGTSLTRDFVVLVAAEQDAADKDWDSAELMAASAEAAGSTHPAMLCMQRATEGAESSMRHDEAHDWWILHTVGQGGSSTAKKELPIDLVVVGHAAE